MSDDNTFYDEIFTLAISAEILEELDVQTVHDERPRLDILKEMLLDGLSLLLRPANEEPLLVLVPAEMVPIDVIAVDRLPRYRMPRCSGRDEVFGSDPWEFDDEQLLLWGCGRTRTLEAA